MVIKWILVFGMGIIQLVWWLTRPTSKQSFIAFKRWSTWVVSGVVLLEFFQITGFISWRFSSGRILSLAGLIIFVAGIILAVWAKLVMKENWGHPAEHDRSRQKNLVTTGPFALSRNPIYVGLLFLFVGFELALQSWLVMLAIPLLISIRFAIRKEEALLLKIFGKPYAAYCKKIPRFLFVWCHSPATMSPSFPREFVHKVV